MFSMPKNPSMHGLDLCIMKEKKIQSKGMKFWIYFNDLSHISYQSMWSNLWWPFSHMGQKVHGMVS